MIAAVTGATGYVGRFIVERLVAEGVTVRAWRRPSSDLRGLPAAVEWIEGELGSPKAAEALVEGAGVLVHAALSHVPGRYRGGEGSDLPGFVRANVGDSLALLATARAKGVGRCIALSSRAVFGAAVPGPIRDEEPAQPDTHYGAAKAALEAFVRSFALADGWTIAALRPTGVYGLVAPAARSKWFDIVQGALAGGAIEPRVGTEVHGRDVADSVWRLLTAAPERIAGRTFNCSDIVVSTRDIVALVLRIAGMSGPLPEEPRLRPNVMDCAGLRSLGVAFGGVPLLEQTVAELVEAVGAATEPRASRRQSA